MFLLSSKRSPYPYRLTTGDRLALNARGYETTDIMSWINDKSRPLTAKEVKELLKQPITPKVDVHSSTKYESQDSTVDIDTIVDSDLKDTEDDIPDQLDPYRSQSTAPRGGLWIGNLHIHISVIIGVIALSMVGAVIGYQAFTAWYQDWNDTRIYGVTRTYQADTNTAIVGISTSNRTHIIVVNLRGEILVTLVPSDVSKTQTFVGVILQGDSAGKIPVEAHFTKDATGKQHLVLTSRVGSFDLANDGKGKFSPYQDS